MCDWISMPGILYPVSLPDSVRRFCLVSKISQQSFVWHPKSFNKNILSETQNCINWESFISLRGRKRKLWNSRKHWDEVMIKMSLDYWIIFSSGFHLTSTNPTSVFIVKQKQYKTASQHHPAMVKTLKWRHSLISNSWRQISLETMQSD